MWSQIVMAWSQEHKTRLDWLRSQRRDFKAQAQALAVSENWTALLEKCADLIDIEAEVRGMECQR
jgi:hypothetical protein